MALSGQAHHAKAQEGPSELMTVGSVRFEGRRKVSERELKAVMKTHGPSIFPWSDRPLLRRDFLEADTLAIESIYQQHGYLDVHCRYLLEARGPDSKSVVFVITEGARTTISDVQLVGVLNVKERDIRRKLHARPKKAFNPFFLIADTTRIIDVYKDHGYLPEVDPSAFRRANSMSVRYDVREGPLYHFGEVYISSPEQVSVNEKMIRRELLIKKGDVMSGSRVTRSVERLYETGLFSQVQLAPLVDSSHTTIEYDLRLRTRKPRWVDAGIGSGTRERLSTSAEWGHRNIFGRGIRGVALGKLALDKDWRFSFARGELSVLEPWLLRTRTRGRLTVYHEQRVDRSDPRLEVRQTAPGASFELWRDVSRFTRVALAFDNVFVDQDVQFTNPTLSDSTKEALTADVPSQYSTHRLVLGVTRDQRDSPIEPTWGSYRLATAEVAGGPLKGTSSFRKLQGFATWYTPWRSASVVATRISAGIAQPFGDTQPFTPDTLIDDEVARVPLEDRFRIGGVASIRGYGESEIPPSGGLVMIMANIELRSRVVGPLGVEAYLDAGNVWARPEYLKGSDFIPRIGGGKMDPGDVRYIVGFGPRLVLPFGALRLDFSWGVRPDQTGFQPRGKMQFAIGPAF
jgi:outer membrane protein assembly complex protein YaeT